MELGERKEKILHAIIQNYLETGEPVGSRTLSKYLDIKLSPATIRNEMSDLEELGYILQPHTSAGRIPSDKGYRFYVDSLMNERVQELTEMKQELELKADKIEVMLKQMAKLLAVNTNYATVVSAPKYEHKKLKFIQLTKVEENQLLTVIVAEGNVVKNEIIPLTVPVDEQMILKLNLLLNTFLQGLDVTQINIAMIQKLKEQAGDYADLISQIMDCIATAVGGDETPEVFTSGATNMLRYPELGDRQKAAELLGTFEEKDQLSQLISKAEEEGKNGIQVYIGEETPMEIMRDCSMVTATYEIEDGVYGKIGIVGPKRMDYEKVVGTLQTLMKQLDGIFKKG